MTRTKSLFNYFEEGAFAVVDSRKVAPGSVFFAIDGEHVDGHTFLKEAAERGAVAAVVAEGYAKESFGLNLFHVKDPVKTLQEMAQLKQSQRNMIVIGVTGSVGKTTTKEFIAQILSKKFNVGKSPGNSNSQIGLPLTLLNVLKDDQEIAVLEMGMNHKGEISLLTKLAPPDIAVITAIELVHAANFHSLREIAEAKAEILSHPKTKLCFIHEKVSSYPLPDVKKIVFSMKDCVGGEQLPSHLKGNLGAAILISRHLGMSEEEILSAAKELKTHERRFQTLFKKGVHLVNDSYNASEPSMTAAINSLPQSSGKTVAVLGEMLELGKFSEECHERVGKEALANIDQLFLVGNGCKPIQKIFEEAGKQVKIYPSGSSVVEDLKAALKPGDVLLLKGSSFWKLWELEEAI